MGWINCREELPEKLQKVLFVWEMDNGIKNTSMGFRCDAGWNIYLPYHSFALSNETVRVSHWSYLPRLSPKDLPEIEDDYCTICKKNHLPMSTCFFSEEQE